MVSDANYSSSLNVTYLNSNRGITKLLQLICGIIICSNLTCGGFDFHACHNKAQLRYATSLGFAILFTNLFVFVLSIWNVALTELERIFSATCSILFIVAFGVMIWHLVDENDKNGTYIPATVFIGLQMLLSLWDCQILIN